MGLEEVRKEILDKAKKEAESIAAESRREAEKIAKDTEEQIQKCRESSEEDTRKVLEALERKERSGAEFDVKKMKLDKKKEMVDRVFSGVKQKLAGIPQNKRDEHVKKLLSKAGKEIKVALVYGSSRDKKAVSSAKGVKFIEADMTGGIIAENEDSSIRVDYSYEEMLDSIQKDSLQRIASSLFTST